MSNGSHLHLKCLYHDCDGEVLANVRNIRSRTPEIVHCSLDQNHEHFVDGGPETDPQYDIAGTRVDYFPYLRPETPHE